MSAESEIRAMVEKYFVGLHHGTADSLASLFHPDCVLKTPGSRRTREKWLADVSSRPVPHTTGHPWQYQIIWIEVEGQQAMAKVSCPLPHGRFIDYLGFLREEGAWKIVNKMYALNEGEKNEASEN